MSTTEHKDYETIESLKEELDTFDRKNEEYQEDKRYNAVAFDYTEENERATFAKAKGPKFSKDKQEQQSKPSQQKILDLKKKMNDSKRNIYSVVVDEHKRVHNGPTSESEEKKQLYIEKKRQEEEEIKKAGGDPQRETLKNVMASEIESKEKKRKNDVRSIKDSQFDRHVYNSYKKRVKDIKAFKSSEHFKPIGEDDKVISEADYGKSSTVPQQNINAMKQELLKHQQARSKSFKKQGINPDEDVSWVNEKNRIFNQKAARAFDPYTLETRQNLERGTAL
ncbi:hypothetical protein SAMD00019534_095450 [Acytostelium subglobosum LB1]|uniref:hypothetical protein n=1 Tax=Acytostelium subglobosum LB1 TaxID=1410327 RepID=UPI000644A10A|nr:hypothetical protein SAMD00019534_095450 [Acytostelium subglobosum LB1]GAM26370.1 hypothetical protein SAMD00019534_095450 [Acytostelium subglobosum LB1]|eukprot:XP_012750466.1 hypothetical protein SAMD00019534_095450 [Acytostelium subglobosum LB1]